MDFDIQRDKLKTCMSEQEVAAKPHNSRIIQYIFRFLHLFIFRYFL